MKLTVIIPALNEKDTIEEVVKKVIDVDIPFEKQIIIVDDGSTDGTTDIIKKLALKYGVKNLHRERPGGKATAIKEAVDYIEGDIVLIQDADLEYNIENYKQLLEPFINSGAEVVFGSRFLGSIKKMKKANLFANKILNFAVLILFGIKITDEATAYKVFKADIFKKLDLKSKGFEFCPEVVAKIAKRKHKIVEIPVEYEARTVTEGKKIKWQDGFIALATLIKYRFMD